MSKYTTDRNGFVTFEDVTITEAGVFPYLGREIDPTGEKGLAPESVYQVYRPEEEINNPETIASFKMQPWIPAHKMLGDGGTDVKRVGMEGVTGDAPYVHDGKLVLDKLRLFGSNLKSKIKSGLKQLSCGFYCDWIVKSGIAPDGTAYDVEQRNIFGNHLASVMRGRVGSSASVAMDSALIEIDEDKKQMTEEEIRAMMASFSEKLATVAAAMDAMSEKVENLESRGEDEDDEEEGDKKPAAMDSASIIEAVKAAMKPFGERLQVLEGVAQDEAAKAEKEVLAAKVSRVYGEFDHSAMKLDDVVAYGAEKSGIACDEAIMPDVLNAFLDAHKGAEKAAPKKRTVEASFAEDSGKPALSNSLLKKLGR